MLELSINIEN